MNGSGARIDHRQERPARVPYLYYVAIPGDPKRRHHFSRTFADFQHFQETHPAK